MLICCHPRVARIASSDTAVRSQVAWFAKRRSAASPAADIGTVASAHTGEPGVFTPEQEEKLERIYAGGDIIPNDAALQMYAAAVGRPPAGWLSDPHSDMVSLCFLCFSLCMWSKLQPLLRLPCTHRWAHADQSSTICLRVAPIGDPAPRLTPACGAPPSATGSVVSEATTLGKRRGVGCCCLS